jgi:hypothetical protein
MRRVVELPSKELREVRFGAAVPLRRRAPRKSCHGCGAGDMLSVLNREAQVFMRRVSSVKSHRS